MSAEPPPAHIIPVILSGGSGSRLWPLSTAARPKQLLALLGDATMIQMTAKRAGDIACHARPIVVASEAHADAIHEQLEAAGIPGARLILEPSGRNTAPAIALAAIEAGADAILLVLPSDHLIRDEAAFAAAIKAGLPLAEQGWIVTLGITPSRPETGYGYIAGGEELAPGIFEAERFVEKPDRALAEKYLDDGGWSWNGGIFLLRAELYLELLAAYAPAIATAASAAMGAARRDGGGRIFPNADAFNRSPSLSIDHAVMEKAARVAVVPVDMGWSDIGSWDALYELGSEDAQGNIVAGNVVAIDSRDCLLRSEGPRVVALGVKDLIVVVTKDEVLIVPRGESQRVKELSERFRQQDTDI